MNSDELNRVAAKTIALMIKAANAVYRGASLHALDWSGSGRSPDSFPVLQVNNLRKAGQ